MEKAAAAVVEEPARDQTDRVFFPMDIWTEILLRVPAEDLVKLKIICKSWHQLITSRSFAQSHLDHWTSRGNISGLAVHANCTIDGILNSSILYFTLHLERDQGRFQCHNSLIQRCNRRLGDVTVDLQLLASCDGLLLVGYAKENHYQLSICNPITGSYRRLPILQPRFFRGSTGYVFAMVRNASTGQYKVFGMPVECSPRTLRRCCHIFELPRAGEEKSMTRNKWKTVPGVRLPPKWVLRSSTAVGGKVHWFAWTPIDPVEVKILTTDILTHEFTASASVGLLPGTDLCIMWYGTFYCMDQRKNGESGLWALENFDHPTWVKKDGSVCCYPPWSSSVSTKQFVMPGGEKLLMEYSRFCYDVVLEASTGIGYPNCLIYWNAEKIFPHVNSLVGFD